MHAFAEGGGGEWRQLDKHLDTALYGVSCQIHTLAALTPWEEGPAYNGLEAGWIPEIIWMIWRIN